MKPPTYSVFVRFRKSHRLTLKRSVPLDVALRFASEVRAERLHDPDDVFIVDDASGNIVLKPSTAAEDVIETIPEAPLSAVQPLRPTDKEDELQVLHKYIERWQLRHAQLTIRGGHRLLSAVERSLGQFLRMMELLQRAKLPGGEVERVVDDARRAIEQVQKARESLNELQGTVRDPAVVMPSADGSSGTSGGGSARSR